MSAKIVKSVKSKSVATPRGVEMSEKFAKELAKFFAWAETEEVGIVDGDNDTVEWGMSLLEGVDYTEAPRLKLEKALETICEYHTITMDDTEIAKKNVKELVTAFKPKKVAKKAEEAESEPEAPPKKVKKIVKKAKVEESEPEAPKKAKKIVKKDEPEAPKKAAKGSRTPKVNWALDTEETEWIDILEYSTEQLTEVFGEPKITGDGDEDDHVYEWKIEMNGKAFSIYDWESEEEYDDKEWHVAGPTEKTSIKSLLKYIQEQLGESEEDSDSE
jgi:hypothetical protein